MNLKDGDFNIGALGKYKCNLKIQRKVDGGVVYFKWDGSRFKTAPETVKLKPSTDYLLTLELHPAIELLSANIAGVDYSFELVSDPDQDLKSKYQFTWSTFGIEPTLTSSRADILVSLRLRNNVLLNFKIQAKFYPASDTTHITWGQVLHYISIDFSSDKEGSICSIDTIKYQ